MITRLFQLTDEVVAFNMAGGLNQIPYNKNIAYAKTQDIFEFCLTLTPKVTLKNNYHHKDFTIVMLK